MCFRNRRQFLRTVISLALAAAVTVSTDVKSARATCGDYLLHEPSQSMAGDPGMDLMTGQAGDRHLPHDCGCRNGSCHQDRSVPVPEPIRVHRGSEHWGCAGACEERRPQARAWRIASDPPAVAVLDAGGLFRPPRIAV